MTIVKDKKSAPNHRADESKKAVEALLLYQITAYPSSTEKKEDIMKWQPDEILALRKKLSLSQREFANFFERSIVIYSTILYNNI